MLAMFLGYFGVSYFHLNPFLIILIAMVVFGLLGAGMFVAVFDRLKNTPHEIQLIATITLATIISTAAQGLFGQDARSLDSNTRSLVVGAVHLGTWKVIGLVISLALGAALWAVMSRTPIGRNIRAAVDDSEAAALQGINTRRTYLVAFALGGAPGRGSRRDARDLLPGDSTDRRQPPRARLRGGHGRRGRVAARRVRGRADHGRSCSSSRRPTSRPNLQNAAVFVLFLLILVVRPTGLFGRSLRVD